MELVLFREPHAQAMELYTAAFPEWERRTAERHLHTLNNINFLPFHIVEDGEFIGLLYCWQWDELIFAEHLATTPQWRGGGFGGKAIEELKALFPKSVIILEIEPPTTEIAARRETFYLRHGFLSNPYEHIHPSYSKPHKPHPLVVMSYPVAISPELFTRFRQLSFSVL